MKIFVPHRRILGATALALLLALVLAFWLSHPIGHTTSEASTPVAEGSVPGPVSLPPTILANDNVLGANPAGVAEAIEPHQSLNPDKLGTDTSTPFMLDPILVGSRDNGSDAGTFGNGAFFSELHAMPDHGSSGIGGRGGNGGGGGGGGGGSHGSGGGNGNPPGSIFAFNPPSDHGTFDNDNNRPSTDSDGGPFGFFEGVNTATSTLLEDNSDSPQPPHYETPPPVTPVPEPSTYGLMGASLLVAVMVRRRFQASKRKVTA